ncbi:hypothetical protein ABIE27_003760 [Paenibacillus sp. 4624]
MDINDKSNPYSIANPYVIGERPRSTLKNPSRSVNKRFARVLVLYFSKKQNLLTYHLQT